MCRSETIPGNWKSFKNDEKFSFWRYLNFKLISKFMTSQIGKPIITKNTYHLIPRSIRNQTTEFGQLIEYNIKNVFLENGHTKGGEETSPRPLVYFWINSLRFCTVYVYCMSKWRAIEVDWNICFYLIKNIFKTKNKSGTSLPASCFAWCSKKNVAHVTFY